MRLRTKLFFSIGSLFLLVALASFFFPRFFIQGDVERVHGIFTSEINLQNKNAREIWQKLFDERLEQSVIGINTALLHAKNDEKAWKESPWQMIGELLNNNPGIGYVQFSESKERGVSVALDADIDRVRGQNIVREYASLLIYRLKISPFEPRAPLGSAAFFDHSSGAAILNRDIFFKEPLFDAEGYYKEQKPSDNSLIAEQIAMLDSPKLSKYFIVNTIPIGSSYLTVGESFFGDIRSTLLISASLIVFVDSKGAFVHAINAAKDDIPKSNFDDFSFESIVNTDVGQFKIGKASYSYFQLHSPIPLPIKAFVLIPDNAEPMFRLQEIVNDNLISIYKALSTQLFITAMVLLGIALIILGYISKRITKPLSLLATASAKVGRGEYTDIQLPKVSESENEVSILTTGFSNMIQGLRDREKIRNLLNKVVSKEIAEEILKGNVQLGGESKIVTILFADIRGFTKLTADIDPQVVISHLNNYMTMMTEIIEREGGVIDKYIGDEIMALYGAPLARADSAARAIKTAIEMIKKLSAWNEKREREGKITVAIGIGIHTGKVVAGNMGAETRLNYTVVGAPVNLASRLCSAAAPMQIRISQDTLVASGLRDELKVEKLPEELYKGFSTPLVTYAIHVT